MYLEFRDPSTNGLARRSQSGKGQKAGKREGRTGGSDAREKGEGLALCVTLFFAIKS